MGSADTARDPRDFAVKFYTEEGNWMNYVKLHFITQQGIKNLKVTKLSS